VEIFLINFTIGGAEYKLLWCYLSLRSLVIVVGKRLTEACGLLI